MVSGAVMAASSDSGVEEGMWEDCFEKGGADYHHLFTQGASASSKVVSPKAHPKMVPPKKVKNMAARASFSSSVLAASVLSDSPAVTEPSPTPVKSFQALIDNNTVIPPDTMGAVGTTHIFTVANSEVRVTDREGNQMGNLVSLESWWNALGGNFSSINDIFDPKVVFDPFVKRFIFVSVAQRKSSEFSVLLAVSATENPLGTWYGYRFDADPEDLRWADFPTLGFNKTWIGIHANLFSNDGSASAKGKAWLISKSAAYNNAVTGSTTFLGSGDTNSDIAFTNIPVITYDNFIPELYFITEWNGELGRLRLQKVTGPVGSETLSSVGFPSGSVHWAYSDTSPSSSMGNAPQAGTSQLIATNDADPTQAVYRNGAIWTAQTVFLPANDPTRTSVLWWQVNTSAQVLQQGLVDDPSGETFYAYPSISVNKDDDVLVGYSRFSASTFPSAAYSFRYGSDPVNTMRQDTVFKNGEASYSKLYSSGRNRWGDYSAAMTDPLDDTALWTIQEYAALPGGGRDRWALWWAKIDPRVPEGVEDLNLSFSPALDSVTLGWSTVMEFDYRVESSENLIDWQSVAGSNRVGSGGKVSFIDTAALSPTKFYRVISHP